MTITFTITSTFISLLNLALMLQYITELYRTNKQLKETDGTFRTWMLIRKKSLHKQIILLAINFAYAIANFYR